MNIKIISNLVLLSVAFILGLIFALGCRIKGDPLPPFEQETIQTPPIPEAVVPKKSLKKIK